MSFGIFLSLGMMLAKCYHWENRKQCLQDRAYRIHHNRSQAWIDGTSAYCFGGAFLVGVIAKRRMMSGLALASPIVTGGLIYSILGKPKFEDFGSRVIASSS